MRSAWRTIFSTAILSAACQPRCIAGTAQQMIAPHVQRDIDDVVKCLERQHDLLGDEAVIQHPFYAREAPRDELPQHWGDLDVSAGQVKLHALEGTQ